MSSGMSLTPQQEQLQRAEMLRNKGIICLQFFHGKNCKRSNCPFAHVFDGEVRPVPEAPCLFFQQGVCLREKCKFFHGAKKDFEFLKASGQQVYRPQDYMPVAAAPDENTSASVTMPQHISNPAYSSPAVPQPQMRQITPPIQQLTPQLHPMPHNITPPVQQFQPIFGAPHALPVYAAPIQVVDQSALPPQYFPQHQATFPQSQATYVTIQSQPNGGGAPFILVPQGHTTNGQPFSYVQLAQPSLHPLPYQGPQQPMAGFHFIAQ